MSQIQQPEPGLPEEARKPTTPSRTPWALRSQHRRPAVVVFIALLIVLQLVLAGVMVIQIQRLVDLEERIEQLEKRHAPNPE